MNTCIEAPHRIDHEKDLLKRFLSIRYKRYGRDFSGADCWGAVILWYSLMLHVRILDLGAEYPKRCDLEHCFLENYHEQWEKVAKPVKHDVIIFIVGEKVHAGFYLQKGRFFHLSNAGASIGNLDYPVWRSKTEGYYRYKNLYKPA